MPTFNRIYISDEVDLRLKNLKARTGLTPNLLCRLGFCLYLSEPGIPDLKLYGDGHAREFNRYTLRSVGPVLLLLVTREDTGGRA